MQTKERLQEAALQFGKTLRSLEVARSIKLQALDVAVADAVESGIIRKFEITVELFWKTSKIFLEHKDGIVEKTPKSVTKSLYLNEYIDETLYLGLTKAINDLNEMSHIYKHEAYSKILEDMVFHIKNLRQIFELLESEING